MVGGFYLRSPVVQPEEHIPAKDEVEGSSPSGRAKHQGAEMPTYDFKCEGEGHVHEIHRRMDDRGVPVKCPTCGKRMKRIFGKAPGIAFRGDGWTGAQKRG